MARRKIKQVTAQEGPGDQADAFLSFSKKRFKNLDQVILSLYLNEDLSAFFADRRIWKLHACFAQYASPAKAVNRAVLKNVLVYLYKHSSLITGEDYIQAVFNMVRYRACWKRDLFTWKPSSKRGQQVNELAFYLFCEYKVPEFLYKAFLEDENTPYIRWFIHIGTGKRMKDLPDMPVPFTQRMGHYFLQAPSNYGISEALRWAQTKAMNGTDEMSRYVAYSWIGAKPYGNEEFWLEFIRLVATAENLDYEHLSSMIDYVREMKNRNPAYALKGRTIQSLLRQSEAWHNTTIESKAVRSWKTSGLETYKTGKEENYIVMEELTETKLLSEEGRVMRHCVATYAVQCASKNTAIFSLRQYTGDILVERLATIEVNLKNKRVVQAKSRRNQTISDEAMKHLGKWALQNNLSLSPYL